MDRKWQIGGVLALAFVVPGTLAQTSAQERPVKRPDGTVIYPIDEPDKRSSSWWRDRGTQQGTPERQERVQERTVTRPDGTVIYPITNESEPRTSSGRQGTPTRGY